jgi:hypothetical protein
VILVLEDPERARRQYARVVLRDGWYFVERREQDALGEPVWRTWMEAPTREAHRRAFMSSAAPLFPKPEAPALQALRHILDAIAEREPADGPLVLP